MSKKVHKKQKEADVNVKHTITLTQAEKSFLEGLSAVAVTEANGLKTLDYTGRLKLDIKFKTKSESDKVSKKVVILDSFTVIEKLQDSFLASYKAKVSQAKNKLSATELKKLGIKKQKQARPQGYTEQGMESVVTMLSKTEVPLILETVKRGIAQVDNKASELVAEGLQTLTECMMSIQRILQGKGIRYSVNRIITTKGVATVNQKQVSVQ